MGLPDFVALSVWARSSGADGRFVDVIGQKSVNIAHGPRHWHQAKKGISQYA
jgi:hypothetical protein